ncbi:unnamed protein product [Owenia fusiformis]|uniref:Uncharacterized protein n=1 Tax=Owenia fusiformis TaxID=6347 RepID=A0A8J1TQS4_OWEFU|nr:unnamed protein product [Owenia fusiformis]
MKFKEFWTNSFTRPKKSKKKQKGQPVFDYVTKPQETTNSSTATSSPTSPSDSANGNCRPNNRGKNEVKANKFLVTDDFTYFDDKRYQNSVNNANNNCQVDHFNIFSADTKTNCACYKHIDSYCTISQRAGSQRPRIIPDNETKLTLEHFGDTLYATVPKNRSRIRTNPWLASPDSMSPASSITSGSPAYSPTNQKPFKENGERKASINSDSSGKSFDTDRKKRKCDFEMTSPIVDDNDRTLTRSSGVHDYVNIMESSMTSTGSTVPSETSFTTMESYESPMATSTDSFTSGHYYEQLRNGHGNTSPTTHNVTVPIVIPAKGRPQSLNINNRTTKTRVMRELTPSFEDSFEYEESLETALDDSHLDDVTPCNSDDETLNDLDKSCDNRRINELNVRQNITQDRVILRQLDNNVAQEVTTTGSRKPDRAYHTLDIAMIKSRKDDRAGKASGRSIEQIRESLEEKVTRLRKEKWVVSEKIRQAKEEERVRIQEKLRFQRQVTLQRKEMLLKTLQELREKLDSQSYRLQASYNHMLFMHRNESRQRILQSNEGDHALRALPVHHPLVKESPF